MKKSSLALITSTIISLPTCGMEIEKKLDAFPTSKELCISTETSSLSGSYGILNQLLLSKNEVKINHDITQKLSPNAKRCIEVMQQPTLNIPDWQFLLGCYANDKEREIRSEGCAELVSSFIDQTSKENCTIGLQASTYSNDLDTITHPESRAELMKQLINHQADTGPALQYLSQAITLYGPEYHKSSFVQIFEILSDAKAFDEKALESFKDARVILNWIINNLENNRPK